MSKGVWLHPYFTEKVYLVSLFPKLTPMVKLEEDLCPAWSVPGLLPTCIRGLGNLREPVCIPARYDRQGGHFSTA